ncbi:MAG TPA: hypothetical protein ENJ60_07605 [Aeromonadales bacterium]|nr:hypothetical protein [Aeromonadales bacterium]
MKLQVVESKSWQWYIGVLLFLMVAMSLSAWIAWEQSKIKRTELGAEVSRLSIINKQLAENLAQKERLLTELDRSVQMSRANIDEVGVTLSKLQEDKKQLEKELTFYRSIMAPEMDKSGLTIDSLRISSITTEVNSPENQQQGDRQYEFELVLTQVKKQDWYIKGRYQIWLIDKPAAGQAEKRISLFSYLNRPKFKPLFSFRYFQTFREVVKIPAQLHPTAIVVTATTRDGKQKAEKRFPWPSEEKTADVQQKEN